MAPHKYTIGAALLLLFCSAYAADHSFTGEDGSLDKFDALLKAQADRNKVLEDTVASLIGTVKTLEDKVKSLDDNNRVLNDKLKAHALKVDNIEPNLKTFCKAEDDKIKQSLNKLKYERLPSIHRRQQGASAVAFSSYLDTDLNNLGNSQVIVFNQVQLNDGSGYSVHTGAFTVPLTGVYVFTFFIGDRDVNQLYVKLVVNGVEKSDAVVETVAATHDAQGGNVVILKVNKGDAVMVEQHNIGSHLEGSATNRLSTFSGFLLYETDSEVIVGK